MGGGGSKLSKKRIVQETNVRFEERMKAEEGFFKRDRIKTAIMGVKGVGKTSVFRRLTENKFVAEYEPTVRANVGVRSVKCQNGDLLTFELWDIPGDALIDMRTTLFDGIDCVIFVADLTQPFTLGAIEGQNKELMKFIPAEKKKEAEAKTAAARAANNNEDSDDDVAGHIHHPLPCVLFANKSDSGVRATSRQVTACGLEHGFLTSIMGSARRDENVYDILKQFRQVFAPNDALPEFTRKHPVEDESLPLHLRQKGDQGKQDGDNSGGETGTEVQSTTSTTTATAPTGDQDANDNSTPAPGATEDSVKSDDKPANGTTLAPLPVLKKNKPAQEREETSDSKDDEDGDKAEPDATTETAHASPPSPDTPPQ